MFGKNHCARQFRLFGFLSYAILMAYEIDFKGFLESIGASPHIGPHTRRPVGCGRVRDFLEKSWAGRSPRARGVSAPGARHSTDNREGHQGIRGAR